jgi:hypothetical protein
MSNETRNDATEVQRVDRTRIQQGLVELEPIDDGMLDAFYQLQSSDSRIVTRRDGIGDVIEYECLRVGRERAVQE